MSHDTNNPLTSTPHAHCTCSASPQQAIQAATAAPHVELPPGMREEFHGFPPPDEPILVACLHCGQQYMSSQMIPPTGLRTPLMMEGMWWCATPGCDAGGFGIDIFPTDTNWKDPKGELFFIDGGDDDEDDDFDPFGLDEDEDDDDDADLAMGPPIAEDAPPGTPSSAWDEVTEREVRQVERDAATHRGDPT